MLIHLTEFVRKTVTACKLYISSNGIDSLMFFCISNKQAKNISENPVAQEKNVMIIEITSFP